MTGAVAGMWGLSSASQVKHDQLQDKDSESVSFNLESPGTEDAVFIDLLAQSFHARIR